ncbi:MAG: exodeoxyribonuclease VII large subunit, partial [Chlamydiales bacterium]
MIPKLTDLMEEVFTVTELTSLIKKQLETRFSFVTVRGEVSNFKEQSSGHLYFTLKDAGSQISAVLFKGTAQTLKRKPQSGDQVIVRGELSVYAPRGNY